MMICARGSFTASSDHAHCTYTCGKCGKMTMMHRGHLSCVGGSCRGHWSHDHHVTCHVLFLDILVGLLRLRKCSEETYRPELLGGVSIVRELHVYPLFQCTLAYSSILHLCYSVYC